MTEHPESHQPDLFNDFNHAHVFTCICGAYIGIFNQNDKENPIQRLSTFLTSEEEAQAALDSGIWIPAEAELDF